MMGHGRISEWWDHICARCGTCCHEKTISGPEVIYDMRAPCKYLDPDSRSCTVYPERLHKDVRCRRVGPLRAMTASYLPPTCAYVMWARRHHIRFALKKRFTFLT